MPVVDFLCPNDLCLLPVGDLWERTSAVLSEEEVEEWEARVPPRCPHCGFRIRVRETTDFRPPDYYVGPVPVACVWRGTGWADTSGKPYR